ncbi:GyrI-like domain-containing protein [Paenibacillus mucilaginosus]|uniref:Transcription activator effector binding protein n=3 Tax=Paenibacillus mucilaginosus TaxID=61624 RepID=H6NRJ9_9BACL|nr:effector binding domain-containing protein [Paenibacillus mucilaginosus]AEI38975.1 transcription activator effector binding protein [Paenibacillus mucilaginosus KNP414]AFC27281.1 transcription activator effector binding protein [Paenibacillus mucilaginosus 3016]AFH59422.1 transcriptional regulator [Paenibacillus mucilaginosus K02]MCG7216595.1 GyrI-like domain-containing protein [Paenibacillus mucilaginosus]WDM28019.1 effector binding domain-containing protein [Paenibacillus mucilaginosus]
MSLPILSKPGIHLVSLEKLQLIGLHVTIPFELGKDGERSVHRVREEFIRRRHEIRHAVQPARYVCAHYASEVLFTYFYCLEVSSLDAIPGGMTGFTVPPHRYAAIRSDGDPYLDIENGLLANGLRKDIRALALEFYSFERPLWPSEVDVYVPLEPSDETEALA